MSQVSKLSYVDAKLGAPTGGQQTTRIIYDTVLAPGITNSIDFFRTFANKTLGQTNLTTNKLDSSESMVIKTITLFNWGSDGVFNSWANGRQSIISVYVGNQLVVKRIPTANNAGKGDGSSFDRLHAPNAEQAGVATLYDQKDLPCEIRLLTDIVIPPQTEFYVRIEGNPTYNIDFGSGAVVCALSGYGKIFSAGNSF